MPLVGRMIALVLGVLMVVGCAIIFLSVRPLDFKLAVLGVVAGGLGVDILLGAMRARWPAWALLWLVP